jgi:hypothetical protein
VVVELAIRRVISATSRHSSHMYQPDLMRRASMLAA